MKKIWFGFAVLLSTSAFAVDENIIADSMDNVNMEEVEVYGRQRGTSIARFNPITTEKISSAGLKKLACCNLAESFENSATVTVGFSDAVSGTRQIRMLGLTGTYTQMLDESRLGIRGLGSAYGLAYTPGAWLQGIQISKGTASVASGYEAIAGQINLDYRKPESPELLFVNAYFNSDLRGELNITSSFQLMPKLSGIVLFHASGDPQMTDVDNNNFADQPQAKQINVANRWLYSFDNGNLLHAGWQFIAEDRQGGQMDFNRRTDRDSLNKYGSYIVNRRFNAYAKLGVPLGDDVHNSFALIGDYTLHDQQSFFGQKIYNGTEQSAYLNALLQLEFKEIHHVSFGLTGRGDFYDEEIKLTSSPSHWESLNGFLMHENEMVAGAFGEYTLSLADKLTGIAGVRLDQNNLYGTLFTPRAHLKYNITETLIARASAGRGMHSPNVITDNIWMLASNRQIVVQEKPKMEDAWTYGASLTKYFHKDEVEVATVSADIFHTEFTNQLIVDQEVSGNRIAIYNLHGRSYANNYQIDVNFEPVERLGIFATFRYSDTRVQLQEMGMQQKPLIDRFKGLLNVSYATKFNRWMFDVTAQINGQNRLPSSDYVKYDYDIGDGYSPVYPMFYAQVTHRRRALEIYAGCENIANYMQRNPVISAGNPASSDFNAGVVWGPLMGRKFYAGIRLTIDKL
ncbi:TonB-dependent receptor [Bacteroidia bacterium]|nr:TonB-dependent receptor [Bacteroidia bacterium]